MGAIRPCQCAGRRKGWGFRRCVGRMGAAGCAGPPSSALRTGPSSALRTGFDRLRANGVEERPCDGEWGGVRERRWGCVWVGEGCWWRWGESPAAAGRAVREPPLRGLGSGGSDRGLGGAPRLASLWIPACARMTLVGKCGKDEGGCGGRRGVLVVGGPLRVPSGQASTGSGRTDSGSGPATGSGGSDRGRRRPAPRPSGFLPSQE